MRYTPPDLRALAQDHFEKLKKIKVALFDVDGIMTDGLVQFQGGEVVYNRSFHTRDAYGLKILKEAGIKTGIITGGSSIVIEKWFCDYADVDYIFKGNEDKRDAYRQVLSDGFKDEQILYMGDEFIDWPLLERAGFSATVPETGIEFRELVDYVTFEKGGRGAAREVIDMLRYAQGIVPKTPLFEGQRGPSR